MKEPAELEIDVEVLKEAIRDAVAKREAEGKTSFLAATRELYKLVADGSANDVSLANFLVEDISTASPSERHLNLQPEFQPRDDGHYRLNELLQFHDHKFIWNAYRAILKREPDEEGYQGYLALLRSGKRNKIDILGSLRYSSEGKRANVEIEGLESRARFRHLYQIPVVGYLVELTVTLLRLPSFIRNHRQLESHFSAQQEVVINYFNERLESQNRHFQAMQLAITQLDDSLSAFKKRQAEVADWQQHQVTALFRNQKLTPEKGVNGQARLSKRRADELYAAFVSRFRGDFELIKTDLQPYLALLKESEINSGVIDLGCGRGEWLELLRENNIQVRGVEDNSVLAAQARQKNLDVINAGALEYLEGLENESLLAVTAFHLIEHLEFAQLTQLLDQIQRTLKPGGLLILETPNPKNLVVGACNFYSDPTHRQPLFPETVEFLLTQFCFNRIRIEYLHPVADSPFQNREPGGKELDTWLFGHRDFAAIAWK
jgi:O-antigen chain-terminating methyltransferase